MHLALQLADPLSKGYICTISNSLSDPLLSLRAIVANSFAPEKILVGVEAVTIRTFSGADQTRGSNDVERY